MDYEINGVFTGLCSNVNATGSKLRRSDVRRLAKKPKSCRRNLCYVCNQAPDCPYEAATLRHHAAGYEIALPSFDRRRATLN